MIFPEGDIVKVCPVCPMANNVLVYLQIYY